MRLLFTFFIPSGGLETLNRLRSRALRLAGIESHLLYLRDGAGRQNLTDTIHFITNDDGDIRSILEAHDYDAIIASCDHLMPPRLRGLGYEGPILYEAQGLGDLHEATQTLIDAGPWLRGYTQAIISPPTAHLMELFNTLFPDLPRFYMQNMVDTDRFAHRPAPWLNPEGKPVVSWIGRLEPNKNWPLFLYIAGELAKRKPDLQVWMFVDENLAQAGERERFQALVHEIGLGGRLTIRSNVPHDQMPLYLSATGDSHGLLISTSNTEGFGYAVAEAMGCRCPVLATDSDGVRAFITPHVTGKFFARGDMEGAVRSALELMDNRASAESIREAAERHIRAGFSLARYAMDMVNVLTALGIRR
ncbi:glycosyltransferase family 4 protein [Paenibacillus methanolicus]|uniref:Glycosyl transferase family 1 n=1 Tax=Paenibacillus methanolicus TaxID=582686 RepID=A0A5S5BW82_9BACL|nr:glycosyltransferase family 4 protein [Paenibacillus methanolicus]TYP69863.1 glycosyl transferase family 1 [Paenibacillus methanolicus]